MIDATLHHLRMALSELKLAKPSRETSITITKVDEAILWRERDLRVNTPPTNQQSESA